MELRTMFDKICIDTGQFFGGDSLEIDMDKFIILVKSTLGVYNQYVPHDKKFNIHLSGGQTYDFQEDLVVDGLKLGIPKWISDVVPVRLAGVHPWYFRHKEEYVNKELEYKKQFPWDYRAPTLYVPVQAEYEIHAVWEHKVTEIKTPAGQDKQYEVSTIDYYNDDFFDLLEAKFLRAIGRNRRAFTLNDMPITTDAESLISEANDLEAHALDEMSNKTNKFYLSWR